MRHGGEAKYQKYHNVPSRFITIMALWHLLTWARMSVTHCEDCLWIHQSAQTASSELCILQIVNGLYRDSPPNPREVLNCMSSERIYKNVEQCALPVYHHNGFMAPPNLGTGMYVTHCEDLHCGGHQSAQTASSELMHIAIVNVLYRDSPPNPRECSTA